MKPEEKIISTQVYKVLFDSLTEHRIETVRRFGPGSFCLISFVEPNLDERVL